MLGGLEVNATWAGVQDGGYSFDLAPASGQ